MYDTIRLKSPILTYDKIDLIKCKCIQRQGLDLESGEMLYQITTGSLTGSFDSRISIKIESVEALSNLCIEASVHKACVGHNVFSGPVDFQKSCAFLINLVSNLLEVQLPSYEVWFVSRVDIAEVYQLPSFDAVQEYFSFLQIANYSRRKVYRYHNETIYASGSTTTLKLYHKGPEVRKNDSKRLQQIFSKAEYDDIISIADKTLRVEVEVHSRKIHDDFEKLGKKCIVANFTDSYFVDIFDNDVLKFLKEGVNVNKVVRTANDVQKRLYEVYSSRMASVLLGSWFKLSAMGEDYLKRSLPHNTFYRHRRLLLEAGVSWNGTDIFLDDSVRRLVPVDFVPVRSSINRDKSYYDFDLKKVV